MIKIWNMTCEYPREALASIAKREINAAEVVTVLDGLLAEIGKRYFIRCDNGPEFMAKVVENWACEVGTTSYFITPGSPWLHRRVKLFNARLRVGLLNGELFASIGETQILFDKWRDEYNNHCPHFSLGYLPRKSFLALPTDQQGNVLIKSPKLYHFKVEHHKQAA